MRPLPVAAVYDRRQLEGPAPSGPRTTRRSSFHDDTAVKDRRYSLLVAIALALIACGTCGPDQLGQIKPGMKPDQVTAILGTPTRIDQSETTGVNGEVYHYPSSTGESRVVFLNNAVFKAEFVPGAKS